jgi:SAM-dependent methyltransferase
MRHLPFRDSSFSWALSIFGSFGWLGDEDNLEVLKETGRVLKKDGKALLDIWSEEYFARLTDDVIRRDMKGGGYLIQKLKYNPNQKRLLVTRTIASGDRERTGSVSLRLYSVSEMKGILEALGFKIANIVDNHLSGNGGEKITATVMICEKS